MSKKKYYYVGKKYFYMVLDSRAQYDIEAACVLEGCGHEKPSWKSLRELWGDQGAVLVRYEDAETLINPKIIGVIS